jgi:Fic family protein
VDDIVETVNHFKCIDMVIDNANRSLNENFIKHLHLTLKSGTSDSRKDWFATGDYKKLPNEVGGKVTASPEEVPAQMKKLLAGYNRQSEKSLDDLLDFHYRFERIHPFQDGNDRLSRALTILLLLRCGYVYVPYSSLESVIEATKQSYYLSLRATQKTLQSENPDWSVWIRYFLKSLVKQIRNLKVKIENEHLLRTMPEISLRLIETIRDHGPISVADAQALLRVNKYTLRDHFKRLTEDGHLVRIGVGRATKYALH